MWIKICGCRDPEDIAAAAAAGADAFGLILAPGFRRTLTVDEAARLRSVAPPGIEAVGVFVAQPPDEIAAAAQQVGLDAVQLHGVDPSLPLRHRYRIVRAWDLEGAEPGRDEADWLLLEPGARRGGGTGRAWDWSRAALHRPRLPFALAGGLTPDTVAAACAATAPDGVDVSSGVETDGRKDPQKIARFCQAARRWAHGEDDRRPRP